MTGLRSACSLSLLALGMICLVGGVSAGLARLAWDVPLATAAGWHGALMISAFFGAVISLERAVAVGRGWAYLAPACAGLGGVLLLAGVPHASAQILLSAAAAILVIGSAVVIGRLAALFTFVLATGALCWLIGNLVWTAEDAVTAAVPWWLCFLILTVAAERLELTRFLPTPVTARRLFVAIVGAIFAGAALGLWVDDLGLRLFSFGLAALAVWLMRYDIARINVRQKGLTRFIAVCLLLGYCWLVAAGLLGLKGAFLAGHPWRDAALHAIGLGFVFSMVLGHAPVIVPAVTRLKLPYHAVFYLPLLLLHASLTLRVVGVVCENFALRRYGGLANACALLIFISVVVSGIVRGRLQKGVRAV
jgi:hypothetical protein